MRRVLSALAAALVPVCASAQRGITDIFVQDGSPVGTGWAGFTDLSFLLNTLLTLILATCLGAALAFHPRLADTTDTIEEIEARKVYMLYSVIGALIGILVVKYGLVVGFVLFGIGGLIRFRTILRSAVLTGQVIFVTLIGLSCGLDLPHVAVLATAFGFGLIYVLDAQITCQAEIQQLPAERYAEAASAYRKAIEDLGCKVIRERKYPGKRRLELMFVGGRFRSGSELAAAIDAAIDPSLRGTIDWELS